MSANNRLAAGLAAVSSRPAGPARPPRPTEQDRPTTPPAGRYEDRTRRATFHVDVANLEGIDQAAIRTGMSKARIVNEAIRRYLAELM